MREEREYLAHIYPAGKYVCKTCGDRNLAGESFRMDPTVFGIEYLCPDCHAHVVEREKKRKKEIYSLGEEEPSDTDEVVCPWCGHEHSDSWELEDSDDEYECDYCGKIFSYERHCEITYSSSRVED